MINRLILLLFVLTLITSTAFAVTNPPQELSLTVEQLASMSDYDRQQYLNAVKSAKELKADTLIALPQAVEDSISMLENVNVSGLALKAEEIAGAIVKFCSTLGVGVEKFIYSRTGMIISLGIIWKIGMIGDFKDFMIMFSGIIFFTWIIYAANTNKIVHLKEYGKNDKGKMEVVSSREVTMPRLNALFTYIGARREDNKTQKPEEIGVYRIIVTVISTILLVMFAIAI